MKKVMISQPMAGLTDTEIIAAKEKAAAYLTAQGFETVDSYFEAEHKAKYENENLTEYANIPLYFMSKAVRVMSLCDAVYFVDGWQEARGCRMEHKLASAYGLELLYETDLKDDIEDDNEQEMVRRSIRLNDIIANANNYWARCNPETRIQLMATYKDLTGNPLSFDYACMTETLMPDDGLQNFIITITKR